jgi:hypothetical protein
MIELTGPLNSFRWEVALRGGVQAYDVIGSLKLRINRQYYSVAAQDLESCYLYFYRLGTNL